MRDRSIHGYDTVDLQIVWDVVQQDIPEIRPGTRQILADYGPSISFHGRLCSLLELPDSAGWISTISTLPLEREIGPISETGSIWLSLLAAGWR